MSSAPTANVNNTPREPSTAAAVLSYLIPGLGQLYQGRYGKGILFMISLLGMFMLGQAMGEWQNVFVPRETGQGQRGNLLQSLITRWHYAGQFWIGVAAWPALGHYFGIIPDRNPDQPDETESFLHVYQRAPDERKLNNFLVNSDKTPDLGWVYTVVAGMLNILVIYDAYAGPVLAPLPKPAAKDSSAAKMQAQKEGVA
jgi:hypothetical protein